MMTHPAGGVAGGARGTDGAYLDADRVRDVERLCQQARLVGVQLTARTFEHELRNVLTVALGYADSLANDAELSERARRRADRIRESTVAAVAVLRELAQALTPEALDEVDWGTAHGSTLRVSRAPVIAVGEARAAAV